MMLIFHRTDMVAGGLVGVNQSGMTSGEIYAWFAADMNKEL